MMSIFYVSVCRLDSSVIFGKPPFAFVAIFFFNVALCFLFVELSELSVDPWCQSLVRCMVCEYFLPTNFYEVVVEDFDNFS